MMYIGYDIGSSSVKAALVDAESGKLIALTSAPKTEMLIQSTQNDFAEQSPLDWWQYVCDTTKELFRLSGRKGSEIKGVGISYQMHGLVCLDVNGDLLRDSIIWCDSRAVNIGNEAYVSLGAQYCKEHLLNTPGNFTASKLKWVKDNEPDLFRKIDTIMLPGDYIAYRLSGQKNTTISGLSEGVFWDFKTHGLSEKLLEEYDLDPSLFPAITATFGDQSELNAEGEKATGIPQGTPILYRAGDQPNNALSLNVFEVGDVAATGGTSGVIYAITDSYKVQELERINNFAHVNHSKEKIRVGKLLNINGAGSALRWLKNTLQLIDYDVMSDLASQIPVGSDGIQIYPYGNGAERMFKNKTIGFHIQNGNFNRHSAPHLCRATLEGIAFSFVYGIELLKEEGLKIETIKAGYDNLFRSEIVGSTIATLTGKNIEIYDTTGAIGAARACTIALFGHASFNQFVKNNDQVKTYKPLAKKAEYITAYTNWLNGLNTLIKN